MIPFRVISAAILALCALGARADVVVTTLHSFQGSTDGSNCFAALAQGRDGCFYGTTAKGGAYNYGTVFRIRANGVFTNLYSFRDSFDGANPYAGLVQGTDGKFYGATFNGGTNDWGTLFKISAEGGFTSLYSFTGSGDGAGVYGALALGRDGYLYGTTYHGGSWGTIFRIDTNGGFSTLYWFTGFADGAFPTVGLIQGSDGSFYGTTSECGQHNNGTVFKFTTNGVVTCLYSFAQIDDSWSPNGLVQGKDGTLFGTTEYGTSNGVYGAFGYGSVFKISTNGTYTKLHFFTGGNDGANPYAGLARGADGNFYGTTPGGGTNGCGTVFKITANGMFTGLYSFTGGTDGKNPYAGLVQGVDGSLYGTTQYGGAYGAGTVFRITVAPAFKAATLTNGLLTLRWSAEVGAKYQLQCNSNLSSGSWVNLGNSVTAAGPTLSATDSVANQQRRFYRVVNLPE